MLQVLQELTITIQEKVTQFMGLMGRRVSTEEAEGIESVSDYFTWCSGRVHRGNKICGVLKMRTQERKPCVGKYQAGEYKA